MKPTLRLLFAVLALLSASSLSLLAATSTWTGSTDTTWLGANWSPGVPASSDDVSFPNVTGQTVDLGGATISIGTLSFNAPDAYSLVNGNLNLGGNFSQNGAGPVMLNAGIDLGGADRAFGGSGSGVVTLNNPVTGAGYNMIVGAGNYVIANNANDVNQIQVTTGGKVTIVGSATPAAFPAPSYFGGASGYLQVNGGTADYQQQRFFTLGTNSPVAFTDGWQGHGIYFGPNGGTLLMTNGLVVTGPTLWKSDATNAVPGSVVVNKQSPFSLPGYVGPFFETYGLTLGDADVDNTRMYRKGEGDLKLVVTNGATAWINWSYMTNGNLIIQGQPGGDSAVAETNALGTSTSVGRISLRKVHNGPQALPGYTRSFYINQPYAVKFYDAVQSFERDGLHHWACDMSFEPGSSVDFCGGKLNGSRLTDLGYPANANYPGETNTMTIKGGAKLNLNLQLRTCQWEGNGPANGESAGLRVFANTVIQDNGQLKIYRSQTNAPNSRCIEFFRPITGQGNSASDARLIVDLPYSPPSNSGKDNGNAGGSNGVNFDGNASGMGEYPGAELIVNGTGRWGLRVEGNDNWLDNLLGTPGGSAAKNRMESLTGSGGVLTIAATNTSGQMTLSSGPTSGNPGSVGLAFAGDPGHTYVLQSGTITNFGRILVKSGRVRLGNGFEMLRNLRLADDGAATVFVADGESATMSAVILAGNAAFEMGTGSGSAAKLTFANSSGQAWTAGKTLTVSNWNGSLTGGGPDQIIFGTDNTGMNANQLGQITWINPYGGGNIIGAKILPTGEIVPPAPSATITSPAIVNGEFIFTVPGVAGQTSIIQWATNLTPTVNWYPILTNTGAFSFTNSLPYPEVFYRVLVP